MRDKSLLLFQDVGRETGLPSNVIALEEQKKGKNETRRASCAGRGSTGKSIIFWAEKLIKP